MDISWLWSSRNLRILNVVVKYGLVFSLCFNLLLFTRWLEPRRAALRPGTGPVVHTTPAKAHAKQLNLLQPADIVEHLFADERSFYVAGPEESKHKVAPIKPVNPKRLSILKRARGEGADIFLYSAVFGNSSRNASWDRLVLQGWQSKSFTKNMSCCVEYQSGNVVTFTATTSTWNLKAEMKASQYNCLTHPPREGDTPKRVAMVAKGNKCHKYFNWYLVPKFSYQQENKIAVCAKLAYGNLSADDILSWFEIHRRLGVSKVLTYTYHLNHEASAVLEYYNRIGLAEVKQFELPYSESGNRPEVGIKNGQAWNDEQITVYDCYERLRGFEFMITIDFDEYLVPRNASTLNELFDILWKKNPKAGGFHFLSQLHITSWNESGTGSRFKVGRYLDSTQPMRDRLKHVVRPDRLIKGGIMTHGFWVNWDEGYKNFMDKALNLKHVVRPDMLVKGGIMTHGFWVNWDEGYKTFQAHPDDVVLHHFRSCRRDWDRRKTIECMKLERRRDTDVSQLMAKIEHEVLELKRAILRGK